MQLAEEKYRALEKAAMVFPGDFVKMAKVGGVSYNTAKKAWNVGLDGRLPLKDTIGQTVVEPGAGPGGSTVVHGPGAGARPPPAAPPAPVTALGEGAKAEAVSITKALRANAQMMNARALVLHTPTLHLDQTVAELIELQVATLRKKWAEARARGEVIKPEELALEIHTCMKLHQQVQLSGKRAVETMRAVARVEYDLFGPGGLVALEDSEAAKAKAATERTEEQRLSKEDVERELEWAKGESAPPELRLVANDRSR